MSRLERLLGALARPLLVTSHANIRYLTGLESSNAALLADPDGPTLYADFRYADAGEAAAAREPGLVFVDPGRDIYPAVGRALAGRTVEFESGAISYANWLKLSEGGVELVPGGGAVEALRAVKDEGEIDAMRRAAAISDQAFEDLSRERFTGRTERELAWWMERRFRDLGAEAVAFETIVASGENGARPHAVPRDAAIEPRVLVTVDAGCVVDGYLSDCTRTFATGDLSAELADAYALCLRAQEDGLAAIRAGVVTGDADAAGRGAIRAAGLGERFGHGLGHGVGLEIHEAPFMRADSTAVLEPGNVLTVEPGLYLPGVGGMRIEDLVLVTDNGCERLTTFTKDLIVVE